MLGRSKSKQYHQMRRQPLKGIISADQLENVQIRKSEMMDFILRCVTFVIVSLSAHLNIYAMKNASTSSFTHDMRARKPREDIYSEEESKNKTNHGF